AQHTDPEMNGEHEAAMNLTPVSSATHTASADGNWTSGATWNTGTVPGAGSRVVIPAGRTVTYNSTSTANVSWVRVEGTFRFSTTQSTVLNVETIVTTPTGYYEQGTSASPIPAAYTSVITFTDNGALTDTYKLARGLIAHGKTRIHGASLTAFLKTTGGLAAGATQATLASVPSNWKVGDQVAITGMRLSGGNPFFPQDEIKTISAISGSTVTFNSGLTHMRKVDFATWGVFPYVANTTRNIQYKSANTSDHSRKGHVMFMHNPDVDVRYAGFYDLGRTRKDIPVTDSETASLPTGDNPRGKYSLHFHRTGHKNASLAPAYVVGCAVVNSPGWGYVNHDSYVNFEDNVSYNVSGAHYVLENGAERGAFRRNIAIRAPGGSNRHIKDGTTNHDLAHGGEGFWFQGGNYIAENNVASGCLDGGFTWFARSNGTHNGSDNQFVPASLLLDPAQAGGRPGYYSSDVPIMSHKNNTALGCYYGMISIDVEINGVGPTNSVIENFVTLNARAYAGIILEYYRNFTFRNTKVLRDNDWAWNQWEAAVGIQAHNLIDHQYPFQTRSADRAVGLVVRNYGVGVKNFENSTSDDRGEAVSMAKWQVIGAAVDHNCPNGAFNNTGTYNGVALVQNIASEADVVPLPTFTPAAGTYASTQTVSIGTVSGATIYYVIGTQGWVSPSLESQLKTGSWTQYTGPITISTNRKLIAIAVRNGQHSRINSGHFNIDANATPTAPAAPTNLTATAGNGQVSLSWAGSSGATGYTVWSRAGSATTFTNVASPTTTGYTHTDLTNGTQYTYYVTASNGAGTSAASTQASATPTAGTTTPPPAGSFSGTYKITARHSGKALDVNANGTTDGTNVQQWTDNGSTAQQWIITATTDGHYRLVGNGSGKALEVSNSSLADGGNVQIWSYVGANTQQWKIEATTDGYYRLLNRNSGKALDVNGNSTADGANVHQWTYGGGLNQQWLITQLSTATARESFEGAAVETVSLYPNPVTDGTLHVRVYARAAGKASIALSPPTGGRALAQEYALRPGANLLKVNTARLATGLYLLSVQQDGQKTVQKVVIGR
ncbi:MAG: RICIN domain-containing protein, partial [Cytophagales bacterium]|nr:RICIN domain-containing protein [Cytophagales bacterium]